MMWVRRVAVCLLVLPLLGGCSGAAPKGWNGSQASLETKPNLAAQPVEELYNHGIDALRQQDYAEAVRLFTAIEQNYPYSSWTVNAQLMHGYADYMRDHYTDAIAALDRFIQLHPANRDIAYAYYLRALCYYEQIADIQRDQKTTVQAMAALQEVVNRFPDSAYGRDARLKIDLCRDHLAGKEMSIGRWYEKQHFYEAAIGRYQRVVDDFQTTNHVAEALSRLTEIYLKLGMVDEAKRTAAVLGYNYPGSRWYAIAYRDLATQGDLPHGAPVPKAPAPGFFTRALNWIF